MYIEYIVSCIHCGCCIHSRVLQKWWGEYLYKIYSLIYKQRHPYSAVFNIIAGYKTYCITIHRSTNSEGKARGILLIILS